MKVLIIIAVVVAALIVLALLVALLINGKYAVVREVTIEKPLQDVYDFVKYLKNQNKYSVWAKIDPSMKTEFRGEDGTVGFVSAWDSENKKAGKGEQKIIGIKPGERIDYEIHFIRPFESTDYAFIGFEAVGDSATKVKWAFNGKMKFPMTLMLLFMNMEKMLAPDLQNGLNNLKEIMEVK